MRLMIPSVRHPTSATKKDVHSYMMPAMALPRSLNFAQ